MNIDKYLYKLFLNIVKYIPLILSIIFVLNTWINYLGYASPILAYFGGTSFIFLGMLYLISIVFKFCYIHRLPLHYTAISNIIGILYKYKVISIQGIFLYRTYFILGGITLFVYIYYSYKNRNNPKIDHIKEFCKRYGCCS